MDNSLVRKIPYSTEQITVSTVVKTPTAANVNNTAGGENDGSTPARWAFTFPATAATVENVSANEIAYTIDGSTPSTTNGQRLAAGDLLTLVGRGKCLNLRMIRSGASDAVININYYHD